MTPIPASRCAPHTVTLAVQWWAEPSLFPPSVARGGAQMDKMEKQVVLVEGTEIDVSTQVKESGCALVATRVGAWAISDNMSAQTHTSVPAGQLE